jgi:hypothetical protein
MATTSKEDNNHNNQEGSDDSSEVLYKPRITPLLTTAVEDVYASFHLESSSQESEGTKLLQSQCPQHSWPLAVAASSQAYMNRPTKQRRKLPQPYVLVPVCFHIHHMVLVVDYIVYSTATRPGHIFAQPN